MKLPKAILRLAEAFERLPGIGPKTAQRLTFYLLHVPQGELDQLSGAVADLKRGLSGVAATRDCITYYTG